LLEQFERTLTGMTQSQAWLDAARLVRRTGFGATGADVDAAVKLGPSGYVAQLLNAPVVGAEPPSFDPITPAGKAASASARHAVNKQRAQQLDSLTQWWLSRMVTVAQPFAEKRTFCWHNHFATSATKVRDAGFMLAQNEKLRTLGAGDFGDLAQAMLIDAAMLEWLDGEKNTVSGANENLAREFMELFTLGFGSGYTENDVRDAARALTGWRIKPDGSTVLRPKLHDNGTKTILGVTGNLDQSGFCNAVLAQTACATHVISRTYGQFVSGTAPSAAVLARLTSAYGPQRELKALYSAMFTDVSFAASAHTLVIDPVEWLVGAARTLKLDMSSEAAASIATLTVLGQVPFYPPNVSGWPSGQAWLSTAAAEERMRTGLVMANKGDLSTIEQSQPAQRIDAVGYLLGIGNFSARSVAALQPALSNPAALVAIGLNTPEYLVQ
jgi:uncharacterized protein (DUF1800 family)